MSLTHKALIFDGTVTKSGDSYSSAINIDKFTEANLYLKITDVSGVDPTLDIDVMTYDSLTDAWYKVGDFDQKTEVGLDVGFVQYGLGEKAAIKYVVSGTDSSFTFKISARFKAYV